MLSYPIAIVNANCNDGLATDCLLIVSAPIMGRVRAHAPAHAYLVYLVLYLHMVLRTMAIYVLYGYNTSTPQ